MDRWQTEWDPGTPGAGPLGGWSAVVTGATSGIGRSIAVELLRRGASLMLASRRPEGAAELAKETPRARLCAFTADLTDDDALERWIAAIGSALKRLDLLIHSAGTISLGALEAAPVAELDRQYRLNLRLPYRLTQAMLPLLRAAEGQIVFINSTAAFNPGAANVQYAALKAALRALADGVRENVNADGIRVISVYPGRTATPMQAEILRGEGRTWSPERLLQPGDVAATVLQALLLPRTAEITDIRIRPMRKL